MSLACIVTDLTFMEFLAFLWPCHHDNLLGHFMGGSLSMVSPMTLSPWQPTWTLHGRKPQHGFSYDPVTMTTYLDTSWEEASAWFLLWPCHHDNLLGHFMGGSLSMVSPMTLSPWQPSWTLHGRKPQHGFSYDPVTMITFLDTSWEEASAWFLLWPCHHDNLLGHFMGGSLSMVSPMTLSPWQPTWTLHGRKPQHGFSYDPVTMTTYLDTSWEEASAWFLLWPCHHDNLLGHFMGGSLSMVSPMTLSPWQPTWTLHGRKPQHGFSYDPVTMTTYLDTSWEEASAWFLLWPCHHDNLLGHFMGGSLSMVSPMTLSPWQPTWTLHGRKPQHGFSYDPVTMITFLDTSWEEASAWFLLWPCHHDNLLGHFMGGSLSMVSPMTLSPWQPTWTLHGRKPQHGFSYDPVTMTTYLDTSWEEASAWFLLWPCHHDNLLGHFMGGSLSMVSPMTLSPWQPTWTLHGRKPQHGFSYAAPSAPERQLASPWMHPGLGASAASPCQSECVGHTDGHTEHASPGTACWLLSNWWCPQTHPPHVPCPAKGNTVKTGY